MLHLAIFTVNCPLKLGLSSPKGNTLKGPVSTVEESLMIHSQTAEVRGEKAEVKC